MSGLPDIRDKVGVVTGGAAGIGKGIATQLLAEGMQVVIADVEQEALDATAAELGATGLRTDVSDAASMQALAEEVVERFGAVHVVCLNAGIGPFGPVKELTHADWEWIVGVNLWGVINGVTSFLPLLERNSDGGHIVSTASMAGLSAGPDVASYCVTKFGVVALTESLAWELERDGSKIGVSVLCPGPVRTNIKHSSRNRPAALADGGLHDIDIEQMEMFREARFIEPTDVGALVVDAIKQGDLYVLPHPEFFPSVQLRHERLVEAFERATAREQARAIPS